MAGFIEGLNIIISKVAFLKCSTTKVLWHDGSSYDLHERMSHYSGQFMILWTELDFFSDKHLKQTLRRYSAA